MTAPFFGIQNTRLDEEITSVMGADFSKILLIETSEDADKNTFPVNEPIRFASNDRTKLTALGTGPLKDAVLAINAQLAPLQSAADVTVIRILEGESEDPQTQLEQTSGNIIEAIGIAKQAPSKINATPRLVWVGRTAWQPDKNSANPVVAALPELLNSLLAVAVCDAPDTSFEAATAWRETIQSERIIPIGVGARVFENKMGALQAVSRPMGPRIIGLGARIDQTHGGKPFDPWANEPIYGIIGTTRPISYSLTDGASEGQQMLACDIGIVIQGETGVDMAIADGGFVYLGIHSCGQGELWSQYHQIRGLDYITVKALRLTREFLGKKATVARIEAWLLSLRAMIGGHVADHDILGGRVDFPITNTLLMQDVLATLSDQSSSSNTIEKFRLGELLGAIRIEPAPVIRLITHEIRRYRPAVEIALQRILSSIGAVN